jgi:2-polyprenyl-3-methyl-5-hydroxy-6-metoxy-1,4-benzoquinol methylase
VRSTEPDNLLGLFTTAYSSAVDDIVPFLTPTTIEGIARHNPGWRSTSDFDAYLRASERRYRGALAIHARNDGRLAQGSSVLDVGGFLGAFPLALARLGVHVTLSERYSYYEGAFDGIRDLLEREGVEIWDADLTEPQPDRLRRCFDLVTNMAMLEHLAHSPRQLMENLHACVASDGRLVVEVPNIAYWQKRWDGLLGHGVLPPLRDVFNAAEPFIGHHREYTQRELADLLTWCDFELLDLTTFNYTPPREDLSAALHRWVRKRFGSARELLLACARRRAQDTPRRTIGTVRLPHEDVYGTVAQLDWLARRLRRSDRVIELGCATAHTILLPLRVLGYDVSGIGLDASSVERGQWLLRDAGLDPYALRVGDLHDIDGRIDAIILSEVLAHLDDRELVEILAAARAKLEPGGRLLVTVPNHWSWLSVDARLFWNTPTHRLYGIPLVRGSIALMRHRVLSEESEPEHANGPVPSPHRQRFTWRSIRRVLEHADFDVLECRGSVLCCGPMADILLTGNRRAMRLNERLGRRAPWVASGFWLIAACREGL